MLNLSILLLALLCIGYTKGQFLFNPLRIYNKPTDGSTIKSFGVAMTACANTIVIMDSSQQCMKYADINGNVYMWKCTPEMASSFGMFIYASAGYLMNTAGQIVIIDMYSGNAIDVINATQTNAYQPYKIGLFTSFAVPTATHTWVLADKPTNSTIWLPNWTINGMLSGTNTGTSNSYGSQFIVQLNNTRPILCLSNPTSSTFMVVYEGSNTIDLYSWTAATANPPQKYLSSITGFGEIAACRTDFFNRIYIWDKGCSCLKVLRSSGVSLYNLTLPDVVGTPKDIQASRNKVFIHDDNGILRYDLPALEVTFTGPSETAPTCNISYRVGAEARNGSPPYYFVTVPDLTMSASTAASTNNPSVAYNASANIFPRPHHNTTFTIFDDAFAPEFEALTTSGVSTIAAPASSITPQSGSSSWRMTMVNGYQYGLKASSINTARITANFFSKLEMWLNVGKGVGKFRVDLSFGIVTGNNDPAYFYTEYAPGDLPLNQWAKISIDLPMGPTPAGYNRIVFVDLSGNTTSDPYSSSSILHVDNIQLIPYPNADRYLYVRDFCNATFVSPSYQFSRSNVLAAAVDSKTTSCNAIGANGNTSTTDGTLSAVALGGVGPFTFNWSFTSNLTANIANLTGLPNLRSNIVVFDNDMNTSFVDRSTGTYSLSSTTTVYSLPYSCSIGPNIGALTFFYISGINAANFKALDFYVHGGTTGNQVISIGILDVQANVINSIYVHRAMGRPGIPTRWTKVTLLLSTLSVNSFFYGVQFRSIYNQPRVYFDNIRLISNDLSLSVIDSTGCTATTQDVYVNYPQALSVGYATTRVRCYGGDTGAISLDVRGGTRPYSYVWSNAKSTGLISNLTASKYTVSVTDTNICTSVPANFTIEVIQPPVLKIVATIQNATCYGGSGHIYAKVVGGVDLFSLSIKSAAGVTIQPTPQNIPFAMFTDSAQNSFVLDDTTNSSIVCNGSRDGLLSSRFGYCSIRVSPLATNPTLFGIGCSRCIDGSLYSAIKFWIRLQIPADATRLVAMFSDSSVNYTRPLFTNDTVGWAEVTLSLDETLTVDNFQIFANDTVGIFVIDAITLMSRNSFNPGQGVGAGFTGMAQLATGTYTISVNDANSCGAVEQVQIFEPDVLLASFSTVAPNGESSDGSVTAVVSGGVPPYSYFWQGLSRSSQKIDAVPAGSYVVVITDANGCTVTATSKLDPCNCFNGAICSENGTCICPEGVTGCNSTGAIIAGGSSGISGTNLAIALVIPIVVGFAAIGGFAYFFVARKRERLVKEMASKQRSEINRSEIHLETRIGRGASGEVFKGTLRGTDVAVKKLINATTSNIQEFMFESAVMCALRHPNIVLFMGSCFDQQSKEMLLVMEFLNRGSLHDILHEPREILTYHMKLQIAYQAAVGMNFLHQSDPPIIHRDLKSHNILLDDKYNAKISDFGITRFKEINKAEKKQNISEKTSSLGTIFWTAPEVLDGFEANEKSDCYSFGIVLWELFHMKDPYVGKDPLAVADQVLHKQLRPTMNPHISEEVATLIRACWDQDAKRRPSFQDVMVQLKAMVAGSGGVANTMPLHETIEPPSGFMYIVTMDIENIMSLWDNNTRDTFEDMQILQDMYRTQLEVYMGYEFHTQLGTCSIAFSKIGHAINWCTATLTKSMQLAYSDTLFADPCGREVRSSTGEIVQKGFRLNFGIFSGTPNCSLDPITNATTYFGTVIDTSKRLARLATNGSIAAASPVIEEYEKSRPNLTIPILTRRYSETLNSARTKNLEVYKVIVASLDYKDTKSESRPGTPAMPHVVLTMGGDDITADDDGIETISITNKIKITDVKSTWLIAYSDLEMGESIGRGNLGSYYKGKVKSKEVAVNVLINQKLSSTELLRLMADITIMSKMGHPNVLQYNGICTEPNHLSLIVEYSARNLGQIISNTTITLTNQVRLKIARGIAQGMQYIVAHPDPMVRRNDNLKSHNVMVGKDWDVKVTDYGQTNIKDFARTMTTVTSVAWTAPELLNGDPSNERIAQYSYGMILWELFARKQPYADEHPIKVVSKICAGLRPPIPSEVPPNFRKVIEGCWDINPELRPSWADILSTLGLE